VPAETPTRDPGPGAPERTRGAPILITFAAFVVVVAGLRAASDLVVPFLVAAFIALVAAPPVAWLRRRRVPAGLAVLAVIVAMVLALLLLTTVVGTSVNRFVGALPQYQQSLGEALGGVIAWLQGRGLQVSREQIGQFLDPGAAMGLAAGVLTSLQKVLTNGFLILLTVVFMLLEASGLPAKMRAAIGDPEADFSGFDAFITNLNRYLAIKSWISLATGVLCTAWLSILGVDFAILWGVLAFLLNFVPNLGSIIAGVPAVLLAFIQFGAGKAGLVALGYVVVNVVIGSGVEPRFMGRGLGLSTLVVFLSLVFWGWVFGPVGMLLSVPLTMALKIALESREDSRWLAVLLGTGSSLPVPSGREFPS
jgi:predicted PurR-regulated permease PerM